MQKDNNDDKNIKNFAVTTETNDDVLRKFDKESDFRLLDGWQGKAIMVLCITFSLFQLYTGIFGVFDATIQRAVHVTFGFLLIFLLYPASKKWSRKKINPLDIFLALLSASTTIYLVVNFNQLVKRAGMNNTMDMVIAVIGVLMVLEITRRVVGWPIVIVATVFILYALFGRFMPGRLAHRGVSVGSLVSFLFYTTEGVFGIPIGVSSTFIFLFILFSVYLEKTGMGQFFIDISNAVAGWASGGPAKVAVLSSGLMGTISGSSVANVVGTGSFTIPMMKKLGYRGEFAGAVEATASTGGQLMPPIMGAAAFLMAEYTQIPYGTIIGAAAIPALLYFLGVWSGVHFEAKKLKLKGMSRDQLPKARSILIDRGHLFIPLIAIVYLLVAGFTPSRAALSAIGLSILCAMLRKNTRISLKTIILGLEQGARAALGVLAATACAGIIVGVVGKTGLGLSLGNALVDFSGGNLFLTLFFTMITSLILGMGVPTTANYVITSTVAAPVLIGMGGIELLAAHLFVFYFGIIADVTPPVALAAFAGSGIAKSNPLRTGGNAFKLAIAAFIVPYIFIYNPSLILINATPLSIIQILITSVLGIVAVSSGVAGYLFARESIIIRLAFIASGVMLVIPGLITDLVGLALALVLAFFSYKKGKKEKNI